VLFLVDTGSFSSIIPLGLAREYGLEALAEVELLLADGGRVKGWGLPSVLQGSR
jgi:predicted aspartyl protease